MSGSAKGPDLSIDTARQRLHDNIRKDDPFYQKAREALELGLRYFDADAGHLAQIDEATDHWEAVVTTRAADGPAAADVELDLQDTYCRKTIKSKSVLDIHDAEAQGWADDPAFETHEKCTYLGVPLILDDDLYGTVCFVAEDPRSEQFSKTETRFAEDLTRLLERELAREQVKKDLTNQTNLAAVLNRVIRHNLRNDVTVIGGYTDIVADQIDDESQIEPIRTHVDRLIDLSEKARELERIITTDADTEPTPVGPFVEEVVESVAQSYDGPAATVEYNQEITAPLRSTFERAIRELVENAFKVSSEDDMVEITVDTIPNAVEIRIKDTGPGLPEQECEVLEKGIETPLTHGSGLGLWLAHWIVSQHNGSITPSASQDGTTISITIPRTPSPGRQQTIPEVTRGRDRFQAAFEEAFEAMLVLNSDAHIVNANPAAGHMFGIDRDAMLGRSLEAFFPDEFDFDAAWQDVQETGMTRDSITIVGAYGEQRSIEFSVTADIVAGEHLLVARDITERKQRERRYNELFNNTYQFIGLLDASGTVLEANEAALNFGGFDREDVLDKPFWETGWWKDDDTQQEVRKAVERAAAGESVRTEIEATGSDGSVIIDFSIRPVQDEQDNVTLLIPKGRDITELKDLEREIKELKGRYETLIEAAPDPVFLADSETGEIIETNEAAETLLGKSSDEIIGMHQSELHPSGQTELYRQLFEEHIDSGGTRHLLPDGSPIHIETANGDHVPVEISVATVSLPEGPVTYGIFREVSHDSVSLNHTTEEHLDRALESIGNPLTERMKHKIRERIFDYTFDSAPIGVAIGTLDEKLFLANPKLLEMWGYEAKEEILGSHLANFWKDQDKAKEAGRTIKETGQWNGELIAVRKDGSEFHAQCSASLVTNEEGDPLFIMGAFIDISNRVQLEQKLKRQNKQLNNFANIVSHDIRSPLNVAMAQVQLAQKECDSSNLAEAVNALYRVESIIEDSLVLAREGKDIGEKEWIAIDQIATSCWDVIKSPNSTLRLVDSFEVYADENSVKHIFENLFKNSVEHSDGDVRIEVGAIDDRGFYIEDNGPGIPATERENIFEPGHTDKTNGTGFGLAIVQRVAETHGWEVAISEGGEAGARFEFTEAEIR